MTFSLKAQVREVALTVVARALVEAKAHKVIAALVALFLFAGIVNAVSPATKPAGSITAAVQHAASSSTRPSTAPSVTTTPVAVVQAPAPAKSHAPTLVPPAPIPSHAPIVAQRAAPPRPTPPRPAAPRPTTAAVAPAPISLCGAPSNPYGYNFCNRGSLIYSYAPDVCSYFSCIASFANGTGFMTSCQDGTYSMSGGNRGACSRHGGEAQAVFSGRGPH